MNKSTIIIISVLLNSCTLYIENGEGCIHAGIVDYRHSYQKFTPPPTPTDTASTTGITTVKTNLFNQMKNARSGLYAVTDGNTFYRCNEYFQPHNLPEDPVIPVIAPGTANDKIISTLTKTIEDDHVTMSKLRRMLKDEYSDVLQSCFNR